MSYYLIGIGGTGARCMEAFVHLTGAGLLKDNQPIKLVYVDARQVHAVGAAASAADGNKNVV